MTPIRLFDRAATHADRIAIRTASQRQSISSTRDQARRKMIDPVEIGKLKAVRRDK